MLKKNNLPSKEVSLKKAFCFLLFFLAASVIKAQISGIVFTDGNDNAIKDAVEVGFPYVVVNAYSPGSTVPVSTTQTLSTPLASVGSYTLSGLTTGVNYRIEFVIPAGYYSNSNGSINNTSVQFALSGATNVNLGIREGNKCKSNGTSRILYGNVPDSYVGLSSNSSLNSVMYGDHYSGRVDPGTTANISGHIDYSQIGVPFALTTRKSDKKVFFTSTSAAATGTFLPSPDGQSAIYVADFSGSNFTYQSFKLLAKLTDLGINVTNQNPVSAGNNNIGEYGLGGITISDDKKYLYVVNFGNGKLVKIDISGVVYSSIPSGGYTSTSQLPVTEITIPTGVANCTNGIFRPSVVKYHGEKVVIAGICDASSSPSNAGLTAKIIEYDPIANSFTVVFANDLNGFTSGGLSEMNVPQVRWKIPFGPSCDNCLNEIQPMFSDIAFDDYGGITFSMVNRQVYSTNTNRQPGYMMRTWKQSDGTYVLESNRSSGPLTSTANLINPPGFTSQQPGNWNNNNDGNGSNSGSKWFYEQGIDLGVAPWNNNIPLHPYNVNGGLLCIPGTGEIVAGTTDPGTAGSAGIRYYNWKNGAVKYGARLIAQKYFAMTSVEPVCDDNPIEIGNRVWKDTNKNGFQDADESPLVAVTVCLYDATNTQVATATTDNNGHYIFSSALGTSTGSFKYNLSLNKGTNYELRICNLGSDPSVSGLALTDITIALGETSGQSNTGSTLSNNDAYLVSGVPTIKVKLGYSGENNHSFDFGFAPCTLPVVSAPTVTQPTCAVSTGTIVVNATGATEYSKDNGLTWQASATFSVLPPGSYSIKARNGVGCETTNTPVVLNTPSCCPNPNCGTVTVVKN